jgi:diphthamide synthase (EF-2-diphthine--ammonia ligase)
VEESLGRGFRAFVVACRPPLDASFLGRFLDADLLDRMRARGAAPDGTHHAFVVDGPGFLRRVEATAGEPRAWGDGWRLDLGLRGC